MTDINRDACHATRDTASHNKTQLEVVHTRTLTGLEDRLAGNVDLLVCNPPYVATNEGELGTSDISAAWAGGCRGMQVTGQVIDILDNVLSPSGVAFIVLERCNNPPLVQKYIESLQLHCITVITRRAGIETLSVIRVSRSR